jgi:salicylate hydroxylase
MPAANGDPFTHSVPDSSDFQIAIVGGGIGGLSAALSIAHYCPSLTSNNITVFEQALEYSEIGAGVSIGVSAGRVLQKLGVYDAVNTISGYRTNVHRSNHRWDTDELIVDASAFNSGGPKEEIRQLWLHRAEFLEVLYTEVRKRKCARLETNKRCVSLEVCIPSFGLLEIFAMDPWLGSIALDR